MVNILTPPFSYAAFLRALSLRGALFSTKQSHSRPNRDRTVNPLSSNPESSTQDLISLIDEAGSQPEPFLSLIIPVHNEERRMAKTLDQAFGFVQAQPYTVEVIIVENGSQDRTLEIAQEFTRSHPGFRVLVEQSRGKGLAVRRGMLEAHGAFRFMADADFSMPVEQINRFLPPNLTDYDVAIASREAPGAVRYNEPSYRHLVGRIFNWMIRILALPGLQDTQCGFKCFRGPVAEILFRRQTVTGWSFDVEVLFIARRLGYRVVEVPVPWYFNADSKISVLRDSLKMALDLVSIRWKAGQGVYDRVITRRGKNLRGE